MDNGTGSGTVLPPTPDPLFLALLEQIHLLRILLITCGSLARELLLQPQSEPLPPDAKPRPLGPVVLNSLLHADAQQDILQHLALSPHRKLDA